MIVVAISVSPVPIYFVMKCEFRSMVTMAALLKLECGRLAVIKSLILNARSLVEFRKQIYDIDIAVHDELWYFPNHIRSLRESQMPDANSL